jgi:hypothetical protein
MGAGNLNVTTLKIGAAGSGNPGGAGVGIMNVLNGVVVVDSLQLPASLFASGGGVSGTSGTLNLTNATLVISNGISVAANSGGGTLNVVSSTVELLNGAIGSAIMPLTTLTIDGAILQLNVDATAGTAVFTANTINTNNTTTIRIGAITNVSGPVQIPLISYLGNDPFGALVLGTSPANYAVTLVDNSANSSVDLNIAPLGGSSPHITGISISGVTLSLTATNGTAGGQFTLLGSTNVALPLSQWTPLLINNFDNSGNLNLSTNIVNPALRQQFFILQVP